MKKTLSILLALVMVIGVFPVFADDAKVADKAKAVKANQPAVTAKQAEANLKDYKVIKGNLQGDAMAGEKLQRRDAVIILERLMAKEEEAKAFKGEVSFKDVADTKAADYDAYYVPFIGYAASQKWVEGYTATKFGPKDNVTVQQFSAMMLRALGYVEYTGEKYNEVPQFAKELGLLTSVNLEANDELLRGDAFIIMNNTLETVAKGSTKALKYDLKYAKMDQDMSAKPVAINKVELTFAEAVDTDDVKLSITKNDKEVKIEKKITWNKEKTVAVITTSSKMLKGEHVAVAEFKSNDNRMTSVFDVTQQGINEIVILNETALTAKGKIGGQDNSTGKYAYIYYDIFDQYGNSIKANTKINWTTSAKIVKDERNLGRLKVERSDDKAFTYGELLYVTGVHVKTGMSKTATLKIGQEQNLNSVEIAGFVKRGTTKILEALPTGFKTDAYQMIYTIKDQNGNEMELDNYKTPVTKNQVTFISENIMLIEKLYAGKNGDLEKTITIDGVEYNAILVKPGMKVKDGGDVKIIAIANQTGQRTEWSTSVGKEAVLKSFVLGDPSQTAYDGEEIEIPFTALDQNGDAITSFDELAQNKTFQALSFSASEGELKLYEENDGSAKLIYKDKEMKWEDGQTTDGLSRSVSLTSILIGGETSNVLLSIEDKARPESVQKGVIDEYIVENFNTNLDLDDFKYFDQYGRKMSTADAIKFFDADAANSLKGSDFANHTFGVRVKFAGTNDGNIFMADDVKMDSKTNYTVKTGKTLKITTCEPGTIDYSKTGFNFTYDVFTIDDVKGDDSIQSVGSQKLTSVTVLNARMLKGFSFDNLPKKAFVKTQKSNDITGKTSKVDAKYRLDNHSILDSADVVAFDDDYVLNFADTADNKIKVVGMFNGNKVEVPSIYIIPETKVLRSSNPVYTTSGAAVEFDATLTSNNKLTVVSDKLTWADLYNARQAEFDRRDYQDTIKANVFYFDKAKKAVFNDSAISNILLSDERPREDKIESKDKFVIKPSLTVTGMIENIKASKAIDDLKDNQYFVLDQYGKVITAPVYGSEGLRFTNTKENEKAYAQNNLSVLNNGNVNARLQGAERGDTADVVITFGAVNKKVPVTVGADEYAYITSKAEANAYRTFLIGDEAVKINGVEHKMGVLEQQRLDGLN